MNTVNLLSIDTSMEACSASVLVNGKRYSDYAVCPQQHSQKILPMVQTLLAQAEAQLSDIDYIVFGKGPGSFTGVRIACGIVQGLSFAADIKVIGISTLAAMAYATGHNKVVAASDARMGEVYYAHFERSDAGKLNAGPEQVMAPESAALLASEFQPTAICGTGWQAYPELTQALPGLAAQVLYPTADAMIDIALQQLSDNQDIALSASQLEPTYLRDKVTWKKLPGRE